MNSIVDWNDLSMDAGVAASPVPVLVQFTARWCGPCKMMKPGLEQLASSMKGALVVACVDIDESPALAARHGVRGVPTLLLFSGGKVVSRKLGAGGRSDLKDWVTSSV